MLQRILPPQDFQSRRIFNREARLGELMKDSLVEKVPMLYWPRTPPGGPESCCLIITGWVRKLLGWKSRGLGHREAFPLGSWGDGLPGPCVVWPAMAFARPVSKAPVCRGRHTQNRVWGRCHSLSQRAYVTLLTIQKAIYVCISIG